MDYRFVDFEKDLCKYLMGVHDGYKNTLTYKKLADKLDNIQGQINPTSQLIFHGVIHDVNTIYKDEKLFPAEENDTLDYLMALISDEMYVKALALIRKDIKGLTKTNRLWFRSSLYNGMGYTYTASMFDSHLNTLREALL